MGQSRKMTSARTVKILASKYSHLRWAEAAVGVDVRVGRRLRGDAAGAAAVGHVHLGHLLVRMVVVVVVVVADRVVVVVRNDRLATLRRNLTGQRVEWVEHFHRDTCLLRFVQLLGGWMDARLFFRPYRYLSTDKTQHSQTLTQYPIYIKTLIRSRRQPRETLQAIQL